MIARFQAPNIDFSLRKFLISNVREPSVVCSFPCLQHGLRICVHRFQKAPTEGQIGRRRGEAIRLLQNEDTVHLFPVHCEYGNIYLNQTIFYPDDNPLPLVLPM